MFPQPEELVGYILDGISGKFNQILGMVQK